MDYLDFELEVNPVRGHVHEVAVRSPAGEARAEMHFPFDEPTLKSKLKDLQIALLRSGGNRRLIPTPEERTVQDFGRDLFDTLIAGDVRARYDVSQRMASEKGKGLRLVLRIRDVQLAALPWEFLYDPRKAEYVCLSRHTPIVRYPDLAHPVPPLAVKPPLRILGMAVSPHDLHPLDMKREKDRVRDAVRRLQGLVTLTWFEGRTWRDLQEVMQGGPWHIFHFIGHGGFDSRRDEGFIALAEEDGRTFELSATKLARLLNHSHLKLVLLNTCEGAHGSDLDIFSSTASILVRSGIPSVLAMQYEITDKAATEFSRSFYMAVARGMSIEAAVVEGRMAVSVAFSNTVEWGTPVLYLRALDGHLFDVDLRREQIEAIYSDAQRAAGEEDWDAAAEKLMVVLNGDPAHEGARSALNYVIAQRKITDVYAQGLAHYQEGRLQEALNCLGRVRAAKGDYRDTLTLIAEIEGVFRERRISALREEAEELASGGDFAAAIGALESALALDADAEAVRARLSQFREEQELASLYDAGLSHYNGGRWREALDLFTQIGARAGVYKDVDALAANARGRLREEEERRLRARIDELRLEAERAAASEDWDAAAESWQVILGLDSSDAGAAAGLEEVARRKRLEALYDRARKRYWRGQWQEALEGLQRVAEIGGDYKDTGALISAAQGELEKIRAEERRREQLKRLYSAVEQATKRGEWAKASELLGAVPQGTDDGRVAGYRELIERGRRQEELEELYRAGRRLYEDGLTEQALEALREVARVAGDYKDVARLIRRAEARLSKQARGRKQREEGRGLVEAETAAARTPPAETSESGPSPDAATAPRLGPPSPGAEDATPTKVRGRRVGRRGAVILILIPLTAAIGLGLWASMRGAGTQPPVNVNTPPPTTRTPEPPEGVPNPPSLKVEALSEIFAERDLYELTFSPDGRTLAAGGDEGGISLWSVEGLSALPALKGATSPSHSIAISPDAALAAAGDDRGGIHLWRRDDGDDGGPKTFRGHDAWVFIVAFGADGQTLTSVGGDKSVRRWRASDGKALEIIKLPPRQLVVALAPDQQTVALYENSGRRGRKVSLWSLGERRTLTEVAQEAAVKCGAFSPDGRLLAIGGGDGTVRLWRVSDGSLLARLKAEEGVPRSVTFSPDGRVVAAGWEDGSIRLWRAGDGSPLAGWKGQQEAVNILAFSGDGKTLASCGGRHLGLWRVTGN